ncbi:MAG: tRNA threonylcarbamoyladenosine dehydratase [Verrucomicrobia bacterium]|nr:MAG: tRNA threonylcarbamoyladenosine dehydratase [Verrucomicrobiota bacterium]
MTNEEAWQHRFGGIARLYGVDALNFFAKSRVAVIGIGGVGSWAVEALARSGVGQITLVDLDDICLTNVNRQLHAMDGHIGRAKIEAMAERVRAISSDCEVITLPCFLNETTVGRILDHGFDGLIDAIDDASHKALLAAECLRRKIHLVTCGGAGGKRDATRIRVSDLAQSGADPLLHAMRRAMRQHHGFPKTPRNTEPLPFGIEAVFSDEPPYYAQCDGSVSRQFPTDAQGRLNCTTGFGSVSHLIASFGLIAVGRMLDYLTAQSAVGEK